MSNIRAKIATLTERLKKRAALAVETPITMRYVVAYQIDTYVRPRGEFYRSTINVEQDEDNFIPESEDHIIKRMIDYIEELADIAAKTHLESNFWFPELNITLKQFRNDAEFSRDREIVSRKMAEQKEPTLAAHQQAINEQLATHAKPILNPACVNHVTQLLLNEFALYPNRDRGPLTSVGFNRLLQAIHALAESYPANLQLALGTVPVKTTVSESKTDYVQNMAIIVDCGKPAKLQTVAKAFISNVDPVYSDTENLGARNMTTLVKTLKDKSSHLLSQFADAPDTTLENIVSDLLAYCKNTLPKKDINVVMLNCNLEDVLCRIRIKNKDRISGEYATPQKKSRIKNYIEIICLYTSVDFEHAPAAFPALADASQPNKNTLFGSTLLCQTVGGATYRLACDICLDNGARIAKQSVKQQINLTQQKGEGILPTRASHVVLSNTSDLDSECCIGGSTAHADPFYSANRKAVTIDQYHPKEPVRTERLASPAFGSTTDIDIYPPQILERHITSFDDLINRHNNFVIPLEAMRLCRIQCATLSHIDEVDALIEQHIEDFLSNPLQSGLLKIEQETTERLRQHAIPRARELSDITRIKCRTQFFEHRKAPTEEKSVFRKERYRMTTNRQPSP